MFAIDIDIDIDISIDIDRDRYRYRYRYRWYSPQIVSGANILSNITYQIPKDPLRVFNSTSSSSVFVSSPGDQIYVSIFTINVTGIVDGCQ